jgi:hypothetical protein
MQDIKNLSSLGSKSKGKSSLQRPKITLKYILKKYDWKV